MTARERSEPVCACEPDADGHHDSWCPLYTPPPPDAGDRHCGCNCGPCFHCTGRESPATHDEQGQREEFIERRAAKYGPDRNTVEPGERQDDLPSSDMAMLSRCPHGHYKFGITGEPSGPCLACQHIAEGAEAERARIAAEVGNEIAHIRNWLGERPTAIEVLTALHARLTAHEGEEPSSDKGTQS